MGLGNNIINIDNTTLLKEFNDKNIIQISCGDSHTAALSEYGAVYIWGNNKNNMLQLGTATNISFKPQLVMPLLGKSIKQIACSHSCVFAISDDKIWSWGLNTHGNLGVPEELIKNMNEITELENKNICNIKARGYCVFALSNKGETYYWGEGKGYKTCVERKDDIFTPVIADSLKSYTVLQIDIGVDSTMIFGDVNAKIDTTIIETFNSLVTEITKQVKEVENITKLLKITNKIENGQVRQKKKNSLYIFHNRLHFFFFIEIASC